jgi:hypothetical protein
MTRHRTETTGGSGPMTVGVSPRRGGALPSWARLESGVAPRASSAGGDGPLQGAREHWPSLLAETTPRTRPDRVCHRFVVEEVEAFLKCGILAHGFIRVAYDTCRKSRVMASRPQARGLLSVMPRPLDVRLRGEHSRPCHAQRPSAPVGADRSVGLRFRMPVQAYSQKQLSSVGIKGHELRRSLAERDRRRVPRRRHDAAGRPFQRVDALALPHPRTIEVPLLLPRLWSLWFRFVTRAKWSVAREVVVGLTEDLLTRDDRFSRLIDHLNRLTVRRGSQADARR